MCFSFTILIENKEQIKLQMTALTVNFIDTSDAYQKNPIFKCGGKAM
jgi:hypothetical protein